MNNPHLLPEGEHLARVLEVRDIKEGHRSVFLPFLLRVEEYNVDLIYNMPGYLVQLALLRDAARRLWVGTSFRIRIKYQSHDTHVYHDIRLIDWLYKSAEPATTDTSFVDWVNKQQGKV